MQVRGEFEPALNRIILGDNNVDSHASEALDATVNQVTI